MSNLGTKIFIIVLCVTVLLPSASALVFAQSDSYQVLAPLPGTTDASGKTTLNTYLPGIFNLAIGISVAFVLLNLVFGGFQYMSSDAFQKKEEGKNRIQNSIKGFILVVGAYLILYTVNPKLLELNLTLETVEVPATGGRVTLGGELSAGTGKILPGYKLTDEEVALDAKMREDLKNNYGITVNAPACKDGGTSGCTNIVGMTPTTFKGVTDLKKACNCSILITGGTEGGHASHGPSRAPLDLSFDSNLEKYILANQKGPVIMVQGGKYPQYTSSIGNRNATFVKESDHWHVVFE